MGGLFGGKPDTGPAERAAAETKAQTEAMQQQAADEKRLLAEQNAARQKARLRGGSRMLLSDTRLTPETGVQTLGSDKSGVM
jgi:hypothetical protein